METIVEYDTLYKRDQNGNVREWRMEISGNKYRSVSGVQGGQHVTSEWKVIEGKGIGKAYRDPETQADSEVKSKYTKQLKLSYHSDIKNIDKPVKFDPMLAKKYEGFQGLQQCHSQMKLDGKRCVAMAHGLFSRNGERILGAPHISEVLAKFFETNPDAILDGELYNHDLKDDFNQIISYVSKKKPTEEQLAQSKEFVQYWVYDVPSEGDEIFENRMIWLVDNLHEGNFGLRIQDSYIVNVPTATCRSAADVDEYNTQYLADGYEGQIVRLNGPYENKRSKYLLKRKEFVDCEFKLLDIEEGQGNWSGAAKAVLCELPDGRQFRAGIKGDRTRGRQILADKASYSLATVRFFRLTPDGIPRFGVCTAFYAPDDFEGRKPVTQEELDELIRLVSSGQASQD